MKNYINGGLYGVQSENNVGHGDAKEERAASKIDSRMKTEFRELNKTKNSK